MNCRVSALLWALLTSCASAFIIPEELVSFLSIVYSNIPPIKKGTDSRVGLGFRLGPHADAQIILELGPQTNTRPLGPNAIPDTRKRHTESLGLGQGAHGAILSTQGSLAPSNWLTSWRTAMAHTKPLRENDVDSQSILTAPEDPTKLAGEPLVFHLRKLYRPHSAHLGVSSTPSPPPTSTSTSALPAALPTRGSAPRVFKPFKRKAGTKLSGKTTLKSIPSPENLSDVSLDD